MTQMDQNSAKHFFISRVVSQAQREGLPLSQAEKYMLAWSESDPESEVNDDLVDEFEQETTEGAFETKISALLRRAYSSDVAADPSMKPAYQQAYQALSRGDHYLLVMIDPAVVSPGYGLLRHGFASSLRVAAREAAIVVSIGVLLLMISAPELRAPYALLEPVGFVFGVTCCAVLIARLMGARTFREASLNFRPGSKSDLDLGGTIPVAVISAVLSAVVALAILGSRR